MMFITNDMESGAKNSAFLLLFQNKLPIFAVHSILNRRRLFANFCRWHFLCLWINYKFRPPCGALMRPLPIQGGMQRESGTFFVYKFFRFFGEGSLSRL